VSFEKERRPVISFFLKKEERRHSPAKTMRKNAQKLNWVNNKGFVLS